MARDETMRSKFLPGQDARETTSASIVRLFHGGGLVECLTSTTAKQCGVIARIFGQNAPGTRHRVRPNRGLLTARLNEGLEK